MTDVVPPPVYPTRAPYGHTDYTFPKEVHNLLIVAQQGHLTLSLMADTKASTLMAARSSSSRLRFSR